MFEGMDMGSLWVKKDDPHGVVYRVTGHEALGDTGPKVLFKVNDEPANDKPPIEILVAEARETMLSTVP